MQMSYKPLALLSLHENGSKNIHSCEPQLHFLRLFSVQG